MHECTACGHNYLECHVGNRALTGGGRTGMVCSSWGTPKWYTIHMTAMDYPDPDPDEDGQVTPVPNTTRQHYLDWLTVQQHVLPCCCCRSHFAQHMKDLNLSLTSSCFEDTESFFRLTFDLHNRVNAALNKPSLKDEARVKLMKFYAASRGAKTEEYGRAFVVVQPAQNTDPEQNSILVDAGLVQQGCKLADATSPDHGCVR